MPSPVADLLSNLGAGLSEIGAPWYLFGARAAILYGVARLTADVDVTVRLSDSTTGGMLANALQRHGFRLRVSDPDFIARTRVMPFVHGATELPLDVVLAGPGLEDEFFERVIVRDVDGVRVPVASAEDIVVMKVLAGRPKDQEDVVAIAAAHGTALDEVTIIDRRLHRHHGFRAWRWPPRRQSHDEGVHLVAQRGAQVCFDRLLKVSTSVKPRVSTCPRSSSIFTLRPPTLMARRNATTRVMGVMPSSLRSTGPRQGVTTHPHNPTKTDLRFAPTTASAIG